MNGIALNLALLALRLVRPRPDRRRLARSRGWATVGVGNLALVVSVVGLMAILVPMAPFGTDLEEGLVLSILLATMGVASAVAASWLTLWQTGRARRVGDWIDRAGIALGWAWIVAAPACFWVIVE